MLTPTPCCCIPPLRALARCRASRRSSAELAAVLHQLRPQRLRNAPSLCVLYLGSLPILLAAHCKYGLRNPDTPPVLALRPEGVPEGACRPRRRQSRALQTRRTLRCHLTTSRFPGERPSPNPPPPPTDHCQSRTPPQHARAHHPCADPIPMCTPRAHPCQPPERWVWQGPGPQQDNEDPTLLDVEQRRQHAVLQTKVLAGLPRLVTLPPLRPSPVF